MKLNFDFFAWLLFGLFTVALIADFVITISLINSTGSNEANLVARFFFSWLGKWGLVLLGLIEFVLMYGWFSFLIFFQHNKIKILYKILNDVVVFRYGWYKFVPFDFLIMFGFGSIFLSTALHLSGFLSWLISENWIDFPIFYRLVALFAFVGFVLGYFFRMNQVNQIMKMKD